MFFRGAFAYIEVYIMKITLSNVSFLNLHAMFNLQCDCYSMNNASLEIVMSTEFYIVKFITID